MDFAYNKKKKNGKEKLDSFEFENKSFGVFLLSLPATALSRVEWF